jgi:SulP family sulfate permease
MFSTLTWRTTADAALKDGYHGVLNALISLGLVLTLGLLAFAPLGPDAVAVGLPSAFAAVIVGGTVFALLGRSAAPVVAPSTATAMVLAAGLARVVQDPTVAGIATLIAVAGASVLLMGLLQIAFGIAGLGRLSKYVPKPVLAGFMNGIALLVILSQLPALLGLPHLAALFSTETPAHAEPWRLLLGLGTAGLIWWVARRHPRVPAGLLGLLAGSAVYALLSSALPSLALGPTLEQLMGPANWPAGPRLVFGALLNGTLSEHAAVVLETAAVLAVIGTLESMLAVASIEQHPNAHPVGRRELVALGLANATSGLIGGLPLMVSRVRAMPLLDSQALGASPALARRWPRWPHLP